MRPRLTTTLLLAALGPIACRESPSAPDAPPRADIGGGGVPIFTIQDLGYPVDWRSATPEDISDNRVIVGYGYVYVPSLDAVERRPFYWTQAAGFVALPTTIPGLFPAVTDEANAVAVSDNGALVVGTVALGKTSQSAVLWRLQRGGPTVTALPKCNGAATRAIGVNDAGTIIGERAGVPVTWTSSSACPTPIVVDGTTMRFVQGMNDDGVIVGSGWYPMSGFMTGSSSLPSRLMPLPGDAESQATGVNDDNEVVGLSMYGLTYTAIYRNPLTANTIVLGSAIVGRRVQISDKGRIIWATGSFSGRTVRGTSTTVLSIMPLGVNACGDIVGPYYGGHVGFYKKSVCDGAVVIGPAA